eukprot:6334044-Amphidinium_carterae.1
MLTRSRSSRLKRAPLVSCQYNIDQGYEWMATILCGCDAQSDPWGSCRSLLNTSQNVLSKQSTSSVTETNIFFGSSSQVARAPQGESYFEEGSQPEVHQPNPPIMSHKS